MIAAGCRSGDRVAIWAPNGLGWIVAALGAQCAGAAIVPINTRWKGARGGVRARRPPRPRCCSPRSASSTPTPWRCSTTTRPNCPTSARSSCSPARPTVGAPVGRRRTGLRSGTTSSPQVTSVSRGRGVGATARRCSRPTPATRCSPRARPGEPKGVVMTHAQTVAPVHRLVRLRRAAAGRPLPDRQPVLPHVRLQGRLAGQPAAWRDDLSGRRSSTCRRCSTSCRPRRITVLPGRTDDLPVDPRPPRPRPTTTWAALRVAVTGAADIPVALIEQMRAELPFTSILTGYGLTEAGTVTGSRPDDDATTIATTAGRAMPGPRGHHRRPRSGADGAEVERGATGELLVRGYSVMQHYLDDPRRDRGGDRRPRLPAHRRPGHDGRARLRADRRPAEGHDHRRRVQRVPGRGRERAAHPSGRSARSR